MSDSRRQLTFRKATWKHRTDRAIQKVKLVLLRATVRDRSLGLADFYHAAEQLRAHGRLGLRILSDAVELQMASRTVNDIAWRCVLIKRLSAAMYEVAVRERWPLNQFPQFTTSELAEYEQEAK